MSKDLFAVIKQAIYFSKVSKGAFDITIYPLLNLWRNSTELPAKKLIQKTKKQPVINT